MHFCFVDSLINFIRKNRILAGQVQYCFVAIGPWAIAIIILNTFGAKSIISVMTEHMSVKAVSGPIQDDEFQNIIKSIKTTSKLLTVLTIVVCVCGVAVFQILSVDPTCLRYSPGLWFRPVLWWYEVLFSVTLPLTLLSM